MEGEASVEKPSHSIGIGISTTPNRSILSDTINAFYQFMPQEAKLVIELDKKYTGVAATKNRLLAELDDCEHIFLFDDDCYPIADEWWLSYIEAEQPHLMYQFKLPGKSKTDMQELYRDDKIVAYSHTRGAMIYIERQVLDIVGGFDEAYGQAMFEHPDFTNRIHNAGLTTYRAMDVPNSHELLYCLDQDGEIESSIPVSVRIKNNAKNRFLYHTNKTSKEYKAYK